MERPDRIFWWDVRFLHYPWEARYLDRAQMLCFRGGSSARRRFSFTLPLVRVGAIGGDCAYIVIDPINHEGKWLLGWISVNSTGFIRQPFQGMVRLIVPEKNSPNALRFFGLSLEGGQIHLRWMGQDRV